MNRNSSVRRPEIAFCKHESKLRRTAPLYNATDASAQTGGFVKCCSLWGHGHGTRPSRSSTGATCNPLFSLLGRSGPLKDTKTTLGFPAHCETKNQTALKRPCARAVCWLLKQARAVVNEDEEAASSNRASYEARHTPRAAAVARTARGDCSQPGSDSAAQRRSRAIRLAVRLVRETAPKGARMFTANDMTSTCKAQSSQLAPSLAARHLQGGSRGAPISRTCSKRPPTVARSPKHGELHVAFRMTWLVLSTKRWSPNR